MEGGGGGRLLAGEVGLLETPVGAVCDGVFSEHGGVEEGLGDEEGVVVVSVV